MDHPPHGSKDRADALACAAHGAVSLGGSEEPEQAGGFDFVPGYHGEPLGGELFGIGETIESVHAGKLRFGMAAVLSPGSQIAHGVRTGPFYTAGIGDDDEL